MSQRKKDIMKIRIIQAYAVCKAFLDAYRNEENLKSLEEFGDVVDEISAFVDAFDNSPLFQTLKDIRQIAYEKYQHDWMISHDIDEKVMDKTMQEYIADTVGEEVPFSEWLFDHGFGGSLWVCYDEFLNAEYRDNAYMEYLLSNKEYQIYQADIRKFAKENGLELFDKLPDGWKITDIFAPRGSVRIAKGSFAMRADDGKLIANPEYREALLIQRRS